MDAGKLDRRVLIEGPTVSKGALGGVADSWSTLATVWAQWLPGGGNEAYTAGAIHAQIEGRFRIRYRTDVTTNHRLTFNSQVYDILAVDEIGRGEGLELKVKAHK